MSALPSSAPPRPGSLAGFLAETGEPPDRERFQLESARTLRIDVDGAAWLRPGAALAHRGTLHFERRPTLGAASLGDGVMRELAPLVRAVGRGRLYCGRRGEHVHLVRLAGESITVAWAALLAFEDTLAFEPELLGHGVGLAAGGLVVVRFSGHGALALATHGRPLTLAVQPGSPLRTDPHATIGWASNLTPTLDTDLTWRSLVGHGGHEAIQLAFTGTGFVIVQPYEEPARLAPSGRALKRLASLATG
jgi:uncharacterized protein (AIM24 family)